MLLPLLYTTWRMFFGNAPVCASKDKHATVDAIFSVNKEKIQRLELFSQLQLLQAYSFCFGSDEIIPHGLTIGQGILVKVRELIIIAFHVRPSESSHPTSVGKLIHV